jgi:hypothetical protein
MNSDLSISSAVDTGYLNKVIETERVREVVGVIHNRAALETIEEKLMERGFDRGDIDLIANIGLADGRRSNSPREPDRTPEAADFDRHEVVVADDQVGASVLAYGTMAGLGGMIGALVPLAIGASFLWVAAGVYIGVLIGFVVGRVVRNWILGLTAMRRIVGGLRGDGIAILIRVRNRADERKALTIVRAFGAEGVHAHEVRLQKTLHEVPLAAIKPDPWLGNDRLGG